jgi:sugar lactone lactonase YvrE
MDVDLVLDARALLGESPVWDANVALLRWVNILDCRVHALDVEAGRDESFATPSSVGAIALRRGGGLVLALEDGFWLERHGVLERVAGVEDSDNTRRMNDGKCDRNGRFWAGTMAYDEREGVGTLYRLDPDGNVTPMVRDLAVLNGIAWDANDALMYFIDSPTRRIDVFDYDPNAGRIAGRRPFAVLPDGPGVPDGMTIDAEGCLWVAVWGGSCVLRYRPDGTVDDVVRLPVSQVTSCAFGGDDLGDLFITSARMDLSDAELRDEPLAGGIFRCRPGVCGLRPSDFWK